MKFAIIKSAAKQIELVDEPDVWAAMEAHTDLKRGEIDFGSLSREVKIIVYEFGMFLEPDDPRDHHFSLGRQLFVGDAVIFASDDEGETIDFTDKNLVLLKAVTHFYQSRATVEYAIRNGRIDRPQMSLNGEIIWQWPQRNPNV